MQGLSTLTFGDNAAASQHLTLSGGLAEGSVLGPHVNPGAQQSNQALRIFFRVRSTMHLTCMGEAFMLSPMRTYHAHRTRLQQLIQSSITPVILVKLLNFRVRPLRCGSVCGNALRYAVHSLLTGEQKCAFTRKITRHVLKVCFPDDFVSILLLAAFEPSGKPSEYGRALYYWLLYNIYSNNVTNMIADWLMVKHGPK